MGPYSVWEQVFASGDFDVMVESRQALLNVEMTAPLIEDVMTTAEPTAIVEDTTDKPR